jgi:hypothetical protein
VSGLKESIRIDVQAVKPSTLTAVVGLAKLYEARVLAKKRPPSRWTANQNFLKH